MYTNIQIHSFTHTHNEYSSEELMLKLKLKLRYFGHLMWRADSLEKTLMLGKVEGRRRRGQEKMRWFDGITNTVDLSEQTLGDSGQGSLVCCSPWGCKESDTLLSNWTTMTATHIHTHRHTHRHTHTHTHTLRDWERRRKKCLPLLIFRITDLACVRRWEQKLYITRQTEVSVLDSFLAT